MRLTSSQNFSFLTHFLRRSILILLWIWRISWGIVQEVLLFEGFGSSSCVVLPQKNRLVVDELAARSGDNLSPEFFALQQIEEIQAHRILEEFSEFRFLPVEQILQIIHEAWIFEEVALREKMQVVGIGETLHELQLNLKSQALLIVAFRCLKRILGLVCSFLISHLISVYRLKGKVYFWENRVVQERDELE